MQEDNVMSNEVGKRERERLKAMQKLKKQKIQEILDAQNAAIDADMVNYLKKELCNVVFRMSCRHMFMLMLFHFETEQQRKGSSEVSLAADRTICPLCQGRSF